MATIKDVSRLAKVSVSTVSRVLNGVVPVTDAKRQAVLDAIERLGYRPNVFARSLATNRSGGIGVVVNELSSPMYAAILQGIEDVIEGQGMHMIVSSGHATRQLERTAYRFLMERRTDALVLQLEATPDDDLLAWTKLETPIVIVGRHIPELADRCIHLDNVQGGHLATRYLIGHGHRRIAHITGNMALKDARDRVDGYRQALFEAGIPFDESLLVEGNFVEAGGHSGMQRLLDRDTGFTALFAANDQTAAGAMDVLRSRGLRVPDDVSVIGFDDVFLARYVYPPLTTIRQPLVEMGQAAAWLTLSALGACASREVIRKFEPVLVERESVAAPRAGHTPA
jgi:LacI family transcriptional regulator